MSPFYYSNEWADANVYFNIGKAIFNGKILYTEVFDHKGPLIFFIYGLGYLISNTSFLGVFLIELLLWCAMITAIYYIAKLYLNRGLACIIAFLFPVFLVELMKAGGSAEEFILTFECISLYFFIKYFKEKDASTHNPSYMFVHGILCSMVLFIKINLIMFWFFPLAGIFLSLLIKKEYRNLAVNFLTFLGGLLVVATPIIGYLYTNDALEEAYRIYIELNRKYAELQGVGDTLLLLIYRILYLFIQPLSLLLLPLLGILYFPLKCIKNVIGKWAFVLTGLVLYIIIYMSPVYQAYYPLPFMIYTLLGILSIFIMLDRYAKLPSLPLKYVVLFAFVLFYAGISRTNLDETKLSIYSDEKPHLMTQKMHNIITKEEAPTLLNLGFGLGNSLFTTCNIIPNVKYFLSPNLTYKSYPDLRDEQEKYIKNKATLFVVTQQELFITSKKKEGWESKEREVNNQEYFEHLPAFKENYSLILVDTIINTIDSKSLDIYKLYKRND